MNIVKDFSLTMVLFKYYYHAVSQCSRELVAAGGLWVNTDAPQMLSAGRREGGRGQLKGGTFLPGVQLWSRPAEQAVSWLLPS